MSDENKKTTTYQGAEEVYFAAKEATKVAGVVLERGASFFNVLRANAYIEKLQRMWNAYHGVYGESYVGYSHSVQFTGEQGELVNFPVNHFRNLAQHIYVMITANRPVMEARAVNTDYKSLSQTYVANGVVDYYMREKRLEECIKKAVEMAVVLGTGYIKLAWNATAGEAYDVDEETGQINYQGDIEFSNLSPLDVVFDGTKESWNDNDWLLTRTFKNRYDLMAKYPEFADKIRIMVPKNQSSMYRLAVWSNDETDDIPVYEFYHKRTESMPDGRYMLFVDSDVVLLDTKLPYREIPIYRIVPSEILGTAYGYSPMFDVFPIQEMINSLYSTISTNQNAFGVQNVFVPRGADVSIASLSGGLNVIEANAKPEAINLTATPAEIFKFLEECIQTAETISGVNSVARGNPEASLKSGNALALVQSMSLQFMSGLQQQYVKLIEDVGTSLINMLKDFASAPRIIAIVGKNKRTELKEFTGEQIDSINRVIVDVGNPLAKTVAGRVQMAEQMLQMGLIKTPQQYFQVMNTGRLDTMYEGEMSELLLIKRENELLTEGKAVKAAMIDQHRMHIMEHRAVLADPELRQDELIVQQTLQHIQEHIEYLRTADPDLLQLIGEQPLNPPQSSAQQMQELPPGPIQKSQQGEITQVMQGPSPLPQAGQQIQGPGTEGGQNIPQPARPPAPFENLPTDPSQVIPQ